MGNRLGSISNFAFFTATTLSTWTYGNFLGNKTLFFLSFFSYTQKTYVKKTGGLFAISASCTKKKREADVGKENFLP